MKKSSILFGTSLVLLAGCAGAPLQPREAGSDVAAQAASAPVCTDERDCHAKWRRAEEWVKAHSYWPVQTTTERTIETEGPRYRYWAKAQYRVTRQKTADNTTAIDIAVFCAASVYCEPDAKLARAEFNYFVKHGKDAGWAH